MRFQLLILALVAAMCLAQSVSLTYQLGYDDGVQSGYYDLLQSKDYGSSWTFYNSPSYYDPSLNSAYDDGFYNGYDIGYFDSLPSGYTDETSCYDAYGVPCSFDDPLSNTYLDQQSSIENVVHVTDVITALPEYLQQEYSTDPVAFQSDYEAEWLSALYAGQKPSWFSGLPSSVQTQILPDGLFPLLSSFLATTAAGETVSGSTAHISAHATASATGTPIETSSGSHVTSIATLSSMMPTTVTLTGSLISEAPEKSGGLFDSGSGISAARAVDYRVMGLGLAGVVGVVGLLAL